MLAVTAGVTNGVLAISCDAADDAASLVIVGRTFIVTDAGGAAVSGSPFSGVTDGVTVSGTTAANQSFTFKGRNPLGVSLTVDAQMEAAAITSPIAATGLAGSTVSLSAPTITLGANVATDGPQIYGGRVVLAASPRVTSARNAVRFLDTVDASSGGSRSLTVSAATGTGFAKAVGGQTPLASLNALQASATAEPSWSAVTTIEGGEITTTGAQFYEGPLVIAANTTLKGTTITTRAAIAGGTHSLAIRGNAVVRGAISGVTDFVVSGRTNLGTSVTTSGTQAYAGPVKLTAGPTLVGNAIVTGSELAGNGNLLAIVGDVIVGGAITGVTSFSVTGQTTLRGNVATTRGQAYAGAVVLESKASLTAAGGEGIVFGSTIDGRHDLWLSARGPITVHGDVGGAMPLGSVTLRRATSVVVEAGFTLNGDGRAAAANGLTVAAGVDHVRFVPAGPGKQRSISGFGGSGIQLAGGSRESTFAGIMSTANGVGLSAAAGNYSGTAIAACAFDRNSGAGVLLAGARNLTLGTVIAGNAIASNGGPGLRATNSLAGTLVQNNSIRGNHGNGVTLSAARGVTIGGVSGAGNAIASNQGYGLFARGLSTGSLVEGNTFHDNTFGDVDTRAAVGLRDKTLIWAAIDQGTAFTGQNWQRVASSHDGRYQTAVTRGENIYTSSDYGHTWVGCQQAFALNWEGIAVTADGRYQTAAAEGDYIYTSSDYGATWSHTTNDSPVADWLSVAMSTDGQHQTAVANGLFNADLPNGYIYCSHDYGKTWRIADDNTNCWIAVAVSADGATQTAVSLRIYGTSDPGDVQGYVYNSWDYGATWRKNTSLPQGYYTCVAISGDGSVQIVGESNCNYAPAIPGNIFISRNNGVDFEATTAVRQNWLNLSVSTDGRNMWAVSYQQLTEDGKIVPRTGSVLYSTDSGGRWLDANLPESTWTGVAASGQSDAVTCVAWGNGVSFLTNGKRIRR